MFLIAKNWIEFNPPIFSFFKITNALQQLEVLCVCMQAELLWLL